jgi:L-cysteine/cystine lyase
MPRRAAEAVRERIETDLNEGRPFGALMDLAATLRDGYAAVLHADPGDVALTGSTTDGCNTILAGLDLRPGDEILTSDEEHPGLLAPLGRARAIHGVQIRMVPFAEIAGEIKPSTRLVACSHVSWVGGKVLDVDAIRATGVPFLLDGAQALGAIPVDMNALGCDYYAGPAQKWLCGPSGGGVLYVRRERFEELTIPWPQYGSVAEPEHALDFEPKAGAARFDHGFPAGIRSVWALAALAVLESAGWANVHERAAALAAFVENLLAEAGINVQPRGRSTLVSWHSEDAEGDVERLREAGMILRYIPGRNLVRASVGAWSSEDELERLVKLLPG